MNFLTSLKTRNIFHILCWELLLLSQFDCDDLKGGGLFIVGDESDKEDESDKQSNCKKWRKYVHSLIFSEVDYIAAGNVGEIENPVKLNNKEAAYDCWAFVDYKPRAEFVQLSRLIKDNVSVTRPEQCYVLLNQREVGDRYLIDSDTNLPLEVFLSDALSASDIPFKSCDFSMLTPRQQAEICGGAKIFVSAHGAGNTNMIFTPDHCHIMEFNFRKHWHCDPICDQHFSGELAFHERCDGKLTYRPYFHKADYHNLARLLNKPYMELEIEHCEGINSRNPISRKQLYVNGQMLLTEIAERARELCVQNSQKLL